MDGDSGRVGATRDLPGLSRAWTPPASWTGPYPSSPPVDVPAALADFVAGWPPDMLAVAWQRLFDDDGGELHRPLEVAVFALLDAGLLRAYLARWHINSSALRLLPAVGLPPPAKPSPLAWVAEVILDRACFEFPGDFGGKLYRGLGISQRVARDRGVLVQRPRGHGWRRLLSASYEPDPQVMADTLAAAKELSRRWWAFSREAPEWHAALIRSTRTPPPGIY